MNSEFIALEYAHNFNIDLSGLWVSLLGTAFYCVCCHERDNDILAGEGVATLPSS